MQKKLILGILISLVLIFSLNLVSASLCMGNDRYYHDCDDDRYFDRGNYDNYYYYHGNYYPTKDDYYREYYRPSYKKDIKESYKDTEEYKRTIEYKYEDKYGSEKLKYVINEKTEIELNYKMPYYFYKYYLGYNEYDKDEEEHTINPIPWTYSLYKEYYSK